MTLTPQKADDFKTRWIQHILPDYPQGAGCYLMKDQRGQVFYVGKAKNLRQRLKSYFNGTDPRFFVGFLVQILDHIEVLQVNNEKEALLLEKSLVKDLQPRFNILLKDDKDFIRLKLKPMEPKGRLRGQYPKLEIVRQTQKDKAHYFGPFASASAARLTLRTINKHFSLRTCTDKMLENRTRPCLQYQIGRCPAPCVQSVPDYPKHLQEVSLFLNGKLPALVKQLENKMWHLSQNENYEAAAKSRDQVEAIKTILEEQIVIDENRTENMDIIGAARGGAQLDIVRMAYRKGRLCGQTHYSFSQQAFPTEELVANVLQQVYEHLAHTHDADIIISDLDFKEDLWQLETVLNQHGPNKRIQVLQVHRGHKKKLVDLANRNAKTYLDRSLKDQEENRQALVRLQERLQLKELPRHIECFDVSLFQGDAPVVSQVVFHNGISDKKSYRQYNIKTVEGTDDYAMLSEAVKRRLTRAIQEDVFPSLLIVDGGLGQLHAIADVCLELELHPKPEGPFYIAAIAKSRHLGEQKRGYAGKKSTQEEKRSPERLFIPDTPEPIILEAHTSELFLLERIRDEAHRFAITAHRKKRKKKMLGSTLQHIPGVGPKTRQALLRHFGSVASIEQAAVQQLKETPGVGPELAATIRAYFESKKRN
jgi:excinuclease ABC subunit C